MNERQVKAAVLMRVREANGRRRKPIVTAEFTLGTSGVRADLAIFADTTIGIEIKTVKDRLRRLPVQMHAYAQYFDHAIAIIAPCHLPHVSEQALHGASLWTYDEDGSVRCLIEGRANQVAKVALTDVMTLAERRKGDFRAAIVARYAATSRQFWSAVARRTIQSRDLSLLSRFTEARDQARRLAVDRDEQWDRWLAAQDAWSWHQSVQSSSVSSAAAGAL